MSEQKNEWEQIEDSDWYVSKKAMESIPKAKPKEPEPEPVDTWHKVCPPTMTDEYGRSKWDKQEPNTVPTRECGFSAAALEKEFKE